MHYRLSVILYSVAMAVLCFIIFPLSASEDIFYDSSYQYFLTQHNFAEITQLIPEDYSPPLYAYLLKLFTLVFGDSLFAMRAFSLVAVGGMLYLSTFVVRKAFGDVSSVICTILILCSTVNLRILSDIRPLIFAMFFNMALVLYAYLSYKENKTYAYICMTIFAIMAMYTHYIALLSAFGVYVTVILISLVKKEYNKFKRFFVSGIICAAAYIPWLAVLAGQLGNVKDHYWTVKFSFDSALEYILWRPFQVENTTMAFMNLVIKLFICVAFVVALIIFMRSDKVKNVTLKKFWAVLKEEGIGNGLLLVLLLVIPVLMFAFFAIVIYPAASQRYFFIFQPIWMVILSVFLGKICPRKLSCCVIAVIVFNFCTASVTHYTQIQNNTLEEMNSQIVSKDGEAPAFLHLHEGTLGIMSYYFPEARHYVCSDTYTVLRTYDIFTTDIRSIDDICDIADFESSFYIFDSNYTSAFQNDEYEIEFVGDYNSSYGLYASGFGLNKITLVNSDVSLEN